MSKKRILISLITAIVLVILAISFPIWWSTLVQKFPQIDSFLKEHQEIQTLSDLLQIVLWIAFPLSLFSGILRIKRKSDSSESNMQIKILDKKPIIHFARIEIETKECLWEPIEYNSEYQFPLRTHQLPVFSRPDNKAKRDQRIVDPIFDITIINMSNDPMLLTQIGFQAIRYWSVIKGLPVSGKVKVVHAYELEVRSFIPGNISLLKLDDPIYMEPGAPYRYNLRLKDYREAVPGNESNIKLVVEVDNQKFLSDGIYMGLF